MTQKHMTQQTTPTHNTADTENIADNTQHSKEHTTHNTQHTTRKAQHITQEYMLRCCNGLVSDFSVIINAIKVD